MKRFDDTTTITPVDERPVRDAWDRMRPMLATDVAKRTRGVALLIVLVMVAVLAAFSAEFSYNTRVNLHMASNLEREVQAYYHARSAIEVARMVIRGQQLADQMLSLAASFVPNIKNQNIEMWSYACKFAEIYNTGKVDLFGKELFDLSGQTGIGVSNGAFSCEADAEDGRVNINFVETPQAKKAMFSELFGYLRGPHTDRQGLTDEDKEVAETILNIIDWVDTDEARTDIDADGNFQPAGGGGEDFGYAKYDYRAKNAKMDSVEELRLVDGMDDETFCKLRDKVTVYSTEKLNVNSADIDLLKALICENLTPESKIAACGMAVGPGGISIIDVVGEYIELCRGIKKMLYTAPFNNTQAFVQFFQKLPAEIQPSVQLNQAALSQYIGTKSRVIRVTSTGTVGRTTKKLTAVIDTGSGKYVYWRED